MGEGQALYEVMQALIQGTSAEKSKSLRPYSTAASTR